MERFIFRTRKFEEYGKLSHKNLDDLRSGERSLLVSGEDQKEDSLDFVLWKPKKEGEPFWVSPWGEGRPAGILNVLLWQKNIWEKKSIFTQAGRI